GSGPGPWWPAGNRSGAHSWPAWRSAPAVTRCFDSCSFEGSLRGAPAREGRGHAGGIARLHEASHRTGATVPDRPAVETHDRHHFYGGGGEEHFTPPPQADHPHRLPPHPEPGAPSEPGPQPP